MGGSNILQPSAPPLFWVGADPFLLTSFLMEMFPRPVHVVRRLTHEDMSSLTCRRGNPDKPSHMEPVMYQSQETAHTLPLNRETLCQLLPAQ